MRIFLSSPNKKEDIKIFDRVKVKNRLVAYPLLSVMDGYKVNIERLVADCKKIKGNGEMLMFDSGVSSLNWRYFENLKRLSQDATRGFVFSEEAFFKAADGYIEAIEALSGIIDCVLELDVDHFIGIEKVKKLRKRLRRRGGNLIPVWRSSQGKDEFFRVIDEYGFVALSTHVGTGKSTGSAHWDALLFEAYKRGAKVHVFAFVSSKNLFELPMYSSDCSSWGKGRRWGIVAFDSKRKRGTLSGRPAKSGDEVFGDTSFLGLSKESEFNPFDKEWVLEASILTYISLEERVTEAWERRGVVYED